MRADAGPPPRRPYVVKGGRGDTKGAAEFRKAERFKRTPTFYKTTVFAESQSPDVSEARQKLMKAYQAKKKAGVPLANRPGQRRIDERMGPLKGPSSPESLRLSHEKALENFGKTFEETKRRGSDKLAAATYDRYTNRLWKKARPYVRLGPNRPKQSLGYDEEDGYGLGPVSAWVERGGSEVKLSPQTVREFAFNPKHRNAAYTRNVPLHEWAHVKQHRRQGGHLPPSVAEGGASAFERAATKKLGMNYANATPQYEAWAKPVRRRGERYSLYGQFKRPKRA